MSSNFGMSILSLTEFLLWATVAFLFWKKKLHGRFPAIGYYLVLRLASAPIFALTLLLQSKDWGHIFYPVYFFGYWSVYIASAVLLFFICSEVLRSALSRTPGLIKFGTLIFRGSAVASLIVAFSTISWAAKGVLILPTFAFGLARSVSVLELCLLAFLCVFMNAIHLSTRDMAFGISLGFGLMSANDLVLVLFMKSTTALTAPMQFAYELVTLAALGIWITYCFQPESARKPAVMAANPTISRWNEIASTLGHPGTQVAVQPANRFFLSEVELVVDKVLNRKMNEGVLAS
jgi:hypothetical protein